MPSELVTPTAVLVSSAPPESPEWFAARRAGITATDIPKILGLSQYGNATSVWADKLGLLPPDEAGPAAHWGQVLEPIIAEQWAAKRGTTVRDVGVLAHVEEPTLRASLDRLVDTCPDGDGDGVCCLEIKNRSAFKRGDWVEDVPDDVYVQVMFQLAVTGLHHAHVAVLVGGNDLIDHRVDHDPVMEKLVVDEAHALWECVLSGERPDDEATPLLARVLDDLFPDRSGTVELTGTVLEELIAEYDDACRALSSANRNGKAAKEAKQVAIARMESVLGPAKAARWPAVEGQEMGDIAFVLDRVEVDGRTQVVSPYSFLKVKVNRKGARGGQ